MKLAVVVLVLAAAAFVAADDPSAVSLDEVVDGTEAPAAVAPEEPPAAGGEEGVSCKSCDEQIVENPVTHEPEIEAAPDVQAAEEEEKVTDEQISTAQQKVNEGLECQKHFDEKTAELNLLMKRWNKMGDKVKTAKLIAKLDQEREVSSHVDQMRRTLRIQTTALNDALNTMQRKRDLTETAVKHYKDERQKIAIANGLKAAEEDEGKNVEETPEEKAQEMFEHRIAAGLGKQIDEIHEKNVLALQGHAREAQRLVFETGPENLKDNTVKSSGLQRVAIVDAQGNIKKNEIVNTITGEKEEVAANDAPTEFMFKERSRKHHKKNHKKKHH